MNLPVDYRSLTIRQRKAVRLEYMRLQGGNCYYCKAPLDGPPSEQVRSLRVTPSLYPLTFFGWPVHLHHSHETGMTIGAVHSHCNAVLWEHEGE